MQTLPELRFNFIQLLEIYHQAEIFANSKTPWIDLSKCESPVDLLINVPTANLTFGSLEIWMWRQVCLFYSRVPTSLISSRQRKRTRKGPRLASFVAWEESETEMVYKQVLSSHEETVGLQLERLLLLYGHSKWQYKIYFVNICMGAISSVCIGQGRKAVKQGPGFADSSIISFEKFEQHRLRL